MDDASTDAGADLGAQSDGGDLVAPTVNDDGYVADPDPDLPNPERGIYYWSPNAADPHTLVGEWLYLGPVCDEELEWEAGGGGGTTPVLADYAAALTEHRSAGRKVIVRPRYDVPGDDGLNGCGVFQASTEALMRRHVLAIAAMLAEHADAIAFVEAGYLGRWGEWNTAGFDAGTAPVLGDPERRRAFLGYVVESYRAAGLDRFVGARRPVFARELADTGAESAEWVSLYNDCFMTNESDMGTYSNAESDNPSNFASVAEARAYAETLTASRPFGGETCPDTDPRWADCANMVGPDSEPAALHMSYLHGAWAATARETWEAGGCYAEIKRRLGYRFEIESVSYPPIVAAGERATVRVTLRNTGWARMHGARRMRLVLRSAGGLVGVVGVALDGYEVVTGSVVGDAVASWEPGETVTFEASFDPPGAGSYTLHLWIPDADRPDHAPYAVAFASTRDGSPLFDPVTGENDLGLSIAIDDP